MITFPRTLDEAANAVGEKRAGGVDIQDRYRSGVSAGPLVDIRLLTELELLAWGEDGSLRIGALVRLAKLLNDWQFTQTYPGLTEAIANIATPQIRAMGTVGGNLLQSPRCTYYRHPEISCYRKGGIGCPARLGNYLHGICFDSQFCIAPHPSTLSMALLAYDASIQFHGEPLHSLSDTTFLSHNKSSPLLVQVSLPPPRKREQAVYRRVTSRAFADWPFVEVLIRLEVQEHIEFARVTVGGVAPTPLRLHHVEALLIGQSATTDVLENAAAAAGTQAKPLPSTAYKVHLMQECILDTLISLQDLLQMA